MTKKDVIDQCRDHVTWVGKSPRAVQTYRHDVAVFGQWFEGTTGAELNPQAVDPRDIQEYRVPVRRGQKPSTINACSFW